MHVSITPKSSNYVFNLRVMRISLNISFMWTPLHSTGYLSLHRSDKVLTIQVSASLFVYFAYYQHVQEWLLSFKTTSDDKGSTLWVGWSMTQWRVHISRKSLWYSPLWTIEADTVGLGEFKHLCKSTSYKDSDDDSIVMGWIVFPQNLHVKFLIPWILRV